MPGVVLPKINVDEQFPHLVGAPIVEAIIDIRVKAESPTWGEQAVKDALASSINSYSYLDSQKESQITVVVKRGEPMPTQEVRDLGWKGVRLRSKDEKHIAEFNRNGFIFRRLPPYETWAKFQTEAFRLWSRHIDVAKPTSVSRIGLRYVNRIPLTLLNTNNVNEYISGAPISPQGLSLTFHNFIHRDTWNCSPYVINIARAFQALPNQPMAIILDIDVFSEEAFELEPKNIERKLLEMRWLKNKAFFGILTNKLLTALQTPK